MYSSRISSPSFLFFPHPCANFILMYTPYMSHREIPTVIEELKHLCFEGKKTWISYSLRRCRTGSHVTFHMKLRGMEWKRREKSIENRRERNKMPVRIRTSWCHGRHDDSYWFLCPISPSSSSLILTFCSSFFILFLDIFIFFHILTWLSFLSWNISLSKFYENLYIIA